MQYIFTTFLIFKLLLITRNLISLDQEFLCITVQMTEASTVPVVKPLALISGGQSTQIKYLSKSTDTYN